MSETREVGMVRHYLKGQNLEQLGRTEEALAQYELAVEGRFDSTGPYERLIFLYADMARHRDVIRIAEAALVNVRTYEEKRAWYTTMRDEAEKRLGATPRPIPRASPEAT
jgi:tetratricopeptide (TPR) repeat protein